MGVVVLIAALFPAGCGGMLTSTAASASASPSANATALPTPTSGGASAPASSRAEIAFPGTCVAGYPFYAGNWSANSTRRALNSNVTCSMTLDASSATFAQATLEVVVRFIMFWRVT